MKNPITYSFIIPHHNTPDLLQRLIDTIPQRDDIEIIVVDDYSDEGKKAKISRPDVKTIFIDKEHSKGAGRARNMGMNAATGKWLLFADADDLYKPGFIDVLDEYKDDDIEILFFNVESVDDDSLLPIKEYRSNFHQKLINKFDGSKKSTDEFLFWGYGPWRKMLSSAFVRRYGFQYEEVAVSNDSFFSLQTSYFVRKWKLDKRILYSLAMHKGSLTYSPVTSRKYKAYLNLFPKRAKLFNYIGHPEWNDYSPKGKKSQSCYRYLYKLYKQQPLSVFLQASFYYITHIYSIEKNSNYYVDIIKRLEHKSL